MHIEVAFYSADFTIVHLWFVVNQYGNMARLRYFCVKKDDENNFVTKESMRTKHFIITMMLAALPFCEVLADGVRYLVVNAKDGTKTTFALADEPKVTFKASKMEIVSKGVTFSLSLADISNYFFSDESTGIVDVKKEGTLKMENGRVVFNGLPSGSLVSVYLQDGLQVKDFKADANGTAVVDLSCLPKGIVILYFNKTDIKIINR